LHRIIQIDRSLSCVELDLIYIFSVFFHVGGNVIKFTVLVSLLQLQQKIPSQLVNDLILPLRIIQQYFCLLVLSRLHHGQLLFIIIIMIKMI